MNDHNGPGVAPGRYAGEAIRLHDGHHTAVHEGGVTTTGAPDRWLFSKPDGRPCDQWVDDETQCSATELTAAGL